MTKRISSSIWQELCSSYPAGINTLAPSEQWTEFQIYQLLQQYPAGISRAILLTELEYKWRVVIKRGEHSGKLKQAISIMQLALSDIIIGSLSKLDDFRCVISSDGAECNMIMHKQLSDWVQFMQSNGVDVIHNKTCSFTHCRLLKMKPPVLLPTPLACFMFRSDATESPEESYIVTDVLTPLHQTFYGHHCVSHSVHNPVPDNNETHTIIAEVLGVSAVSPKASALAAAALSVGAPLHEVNCTSTSVFRVVTLLLRPEGISTNSLHQQQQHHHQHRAKDEDGSEMDSNVRIIHLILQDDQIALSNFWSPHDMVIIYRPFLQSNSDEGLYGHRTPSAVHTTHSMAYDVVSRPDLSLSQFYPSVAYTHPEVLLPFHLLYGSVTVLSKIIRPTAAVKSNASLSTTDDSGSTEVASITAISAIDPSLPLSVTARIIDIYVLPVSSVAADNDRHHHQQQSAGPALVYSTSYVVELWLDPLQSSPSTSSSSGLSQLVRVRILCSELPAQSLHLRDKIRAWQLHQNQPQQGNKLQSQQQQLPQIPRPQILYPLKCTSFEHQGRVHCVGHLLHITDLSVVHSSDVVCILPPTVQPSTQLQQPAVAPKPRLQMLLKHSNSSINHQEPGPVSILHYVIAGSKQKLPVTTGVHPTGCRVLNCVLSIGAGGMGKQDFVFPSSANNMIVLPVEQQQLQVIYSLTQSNNAAQLSGAGFESVDNDSDGGGNGSGRCSAVINVSKLTALTGSPSLYLPCTLAEARRPGSGVLTSTSRGCCVYVVASLHPLHEGARNLTQPSQQLVQQHRQSRASTDQPCYQLVRLTDSNIGTELVCIIDSVCTTTVTLNNEESEEQFSQHQQAAKRARPSVPAASGTTSPPCDSAAVTTRRYKSSVVNITSSIYFDPLNGGIHTSSSSSSTAGNISSGPAASTATVGVKYSTNSGKQYALLLSRIDDLLPPIAYSSSGSSGNNCSNSGSGAATMPATPAPVVVAQYRVEVINDVNHSGLDYAQKHRQLQHS